MNDPEVAALRKIAEEKLAPHTTALRDLLARTPEIQLQAEGIIEGITATLHEFLVYAVRNQKVVQRREAVRAERERKRYNDRIMKKSDN